MKKGQGTFEYILLLAGVLLIVVLAIVLLRGGLFQGSQANIQKESCQSALVQSSSCYAADGSWNATGTVSPIPGACATFKVPAASCGGTVFGQCTPLVTCTAMCCGPKPS